MTKNWIFWDAISLNDLSLVTSRLDYGNALLFEVNSGLINKLQRVQNTAARLITRTKKHNHITPVLVSLHWIPVQYRIQYKLLLYTFKALNGLAPIYLEELINIYQPTRSLRSENEMRLIHHVYVQNNTEKDVSTKPLQTFGTLCLFIWDMNAPSNFLRRIWKHIFLNSLLVITFKLSMLTVI